MPAGFRNISAPGYEDHLQPRTDKLAMTVAVALFFMVGFLTCLNDIVSPHLKSIFSLSYGQVQSIPFFFFSSYFVFSYPAGQLVERFGYKLTMVSGLLVMALGAIGFLPAAHYAVFGFFLTALVILAAGMTVVQVAINPYVTVIGPSNTAASRLNLAQAFNSVGTFIAPAIGTALILHHASAPLTTSQFKLLNAAEQQAYRALQASTVHMPYLLIACFLVLLALALMGIKLKTNTGVSEHTQDFRPGAFAEALSRPDTIWRHKWLLFATLGIFCYVGAEVSIGNLLVNYLGLPSIAAMPESQAGNYLTYYWGGTMVGRFIGSALLQRLKAGYLIGLCGLAAVVLVLTSVFSHGHTAMVTMLAVGLCNSILFPSIFTLGIQDLGPLTSKGSSLLVSAILGGALIPKLQDIVADHIGLQPSFLMLVVCYAYIAGFGIAATRRRAAGEVLVPVEDF